MSEHFPDRIAPIQFAHHGKTLSHQFALTPFERACELLINDRGSLQVEIAFATDEAGIATLSGSLSATVQLSCQRCMEPMDITIDSHFEMALIQQEEEEEQLPDRYEALLVDEQTFSLLTFIEDELILAIPVVASHAETQCSATQYLKDPTTLPEEKRENPFQVLEQLKH